MLFITNWLLAFGLFQSPEEPKWVGFEIIGHTSVEWEDIEARIPLRVGAAWTDSRQQWAQWEADLRDHFQFFDVSITRVRYVDGRVYLVVDIVENSDKERLEFRAKPDGSVPLPEKVLAAHAKLEKYLRTLFEKGAPSPENGDNGYLDYADDEAHRLVMQLVEITPPHRDTLIRALSEEADGGNRARAATLLNWAGNTRDSILRVHALVDDPSSAVRNNISRFLLHYTSELKDQEARRAVIAAMGRQLRRPSHGDRNKAISALSHILEDFPEDRPFILAEYGDDIRSIAHQSILSNVGGVARDILNDGKPDQQRTPLTPSLLTAVTLDHEAWEWNWGSWDQDKILTVGDFQYTVFWDADRVLVVGRRDLRDDDVQTIRLPLCTLKSNDRHRNTCLGASLADGRLHLSWDHHNDQLRYTKTRTGFLTDPPKILLPSHFEDPSGMLDDPALESSVTYPRFLTDTHGELFFFYRQGKSGDGDNFLHRYDSEKATWRRIGRVFSSQGLYEPWENSSTRNAYLHDLLFDANNRLHATWVYREVSATWASNHDLHYAYSDDQGLTWMNNENQQVADLANDDPIELSDPGLVVVDIPVYSWMMNAGAMNLDSKNRPHILSFKAAAVQPATEVQHDPTDEVRDQLVFVHYWRDEKGVFQGGEAIAPGPLGTCRGDFVLDKQDNIFFFYTTPEGLRYFTAQSDDQWRSFSGPHVLTDSEYTAPRRNSTKHDRVRWADKGILSFTAQPEAGGFAILDFVLHADR